MEVGTGTVKCSALAVTSDGDVNQLGNPDNGDLCAQDDA